MTDGSGSNSTGVLDTGGILLSIRHIVVGMTLTPQRGAPHDIDFVFTYVWISSIPYWISILGLALVVGDKSRRRTLLDRFVVLDFLERNTAPAFKFVEQTLGWDPESTLFILVMLELHLFCGFKNGVISLYEYHFSKWLDAAEFLQLCKIQRVRRLYSYK